MHAHSFDRLTRSVGTRLTRRRALAALVGLAGIAGVSGEADAAQRRHVCRQLGQKCLHSDQCCSAACDTARSIPRSKRNRCGCGDLARCGAACVDLSNDEANCGACGNACPEGFTCDSGTCLCGSEPACADSEGCCDGSCEELTSPDNCGACGNACDNTEVCLAGACLDKCTPPSGGTCTGTTACYMDPQGVTYYVNNWTGGYNCSNDLTCSTGDVCVMYGKFSFGDELGPECRPLTGNTCVPG